MFHYQPKRYFLDQAKNKTQTLDADRRNQQIAIIDDNEVPYLENLRNNGFSITHYSDINGFEAIKSYPIIICDIKGVGRNLGSINEGAHIIRETRRLYPDKYIIAMSSAVYNIKWVKLLDDADDKIIRDADVDQVIDALNQAVSTMRCPKERWLRVRKNLLAVHNLDLFDVWKIEQEFIKSLISNDRTSFEKSKIITHSNDMIKGLLVNFISGIIF